MKSAAARLQTEGYDAQIMLRSSEVSTEARPLDNEEWRRINGVERPYVPENEPIPTVWTPEHLARRLIEAMKTLEKTQGPRGPKQPGGHWPKHSYDWADRLGWAELSLSERQARDARQNFVADRPTSQELHRMDRCMSWLQDLRQTDNGLGVALTRWVICKCRDQSVKDMCRQQGWSFSNFYRWRDKALDVVSTGLNKRLVPVF